MKNILNSPEPYMNKISKLATFTSHHLEAEQVIPDLISSIKELVENSLDSNSNSITITFFNFGFDSIIIEDDGDGISSENMETIASNRYATSKIANENDLETSTSYGFRGEALHSLIKLSKKVSIVSASSDSGFGIIKTFFNYGQVVESVMKPRTKGTTVTIEGLFECISVRRQDWFKRKSFIFAQVLFLLQSFSILIPSTKFSVFNVKDASSKTSVLHCSGKDISTRYIESIRSNHKKVESFSESFIIADKNCEVLGVYAKNSKDAKNRIVVFINNKPFDSPKWQKLFQQMLRQNYTSGAEFFMSVKLPGLWIDYNVTPDKKTIYILNESEILRIIIKNCESIIRKDMVINPREIEISTSSKIQEQQQNSGCSVDKVFFEIGSAQSVILSKDDISKLIPIGQFNNGFIICSKLSENYTELFAIDQHAADERIRFEEILCNYSISCQKLVHPIKLGITAEEEDFIANNIATIRSSGFLVRENKDDFFLDALPNFHGAESTVEDFKELIAFLKDHGKLYKNLCPKFHRVLASRACRSAIVIGSPLTTAQIIKILNKLSQTDYPWICAHGRPTIQFLKSIEN